jgi:hypothetical protein
MSLPHRALPPPVSNGHQAGDDLLPYFSHGVTVAVPILPAHHHRRPNSQSESPPIARRDSFSAGG